MEVATVFIVLTAFVFGVFLSIRHRETILKWLRIPYKDVQNDLSWRKVKLRRIIEDCQRELQAIEEDESKKIL